MVLVLLLVALVVLVPLLQLQVPLSPVQAVVEAVATLQKALVVLAVAAMEVKVVVLLEVVERQTPEVVVVEAQPLTAETQMAALAVLVSLSSKSHLRTMPHSHLV